MTQGKPKTEVTKHRQSPARVHGVKSPRMGLLIENPEEVLTGAYRTARGSPDRETSPLSREMKTRNKLSYSVAISPKQHVFTTIGNQRKKINCPNSNSPALALMSLEKMPPVIKSFLPNPQERMSVNKYVDNLSSRLAIPKNGSNGSLKELNIYL